MGLFRRKSAASLRLSPEGPYRATETITVSVNLDEALDGVTAAKVELGYVNVFRYRWAGRADAAFSQGADSLLMMGEVGTNYGTEKDGEAWVHVLEEPLLVADGLLGAGSHQVAVRLPSWAPGSSAKVVQWQVRLHVERGKKTATSQAPFQVLIAAPEPKPTDLPLIQGERALANTLHFEIETDRACYKPGEEVRGVVAVTSREPVSRKALVAGWFQRLQASHPVEKTPGSATEEYTRPMVTFAKDVQLRQHQRAEFPFALTLPLDVDPTTEAVNSSIDWFVQIKVEFAGATGGIERAQRGIVVHTG
ncbi:hypothetical protein [Smaragdicoccus niigatensis]|uniref:hypothetical protein n=1 Tax=Smaragdicoccus niigatensis TaxID=359359 RepID=UPI000367AED6|nr:hypothetical protein [Smaragdicoccus niigatensis]